MAKRKTKPERIFEKWWKGFSNKHSSVGGCVFHKNVLAPFNKSGDHETDFYLDKLDLYIECKGLLTYGEVNKIKWLSNKEDSHINHYLFVADNDDWLGLCRDNEKAQLQKIIKTQLQELEDALLGKVSVGDIVNKSKKRLEDFIALRSTDIIRWRNGML